MILMAEWSEHWWLMVNEYEADKLADSEADEKRIAKVQKSAEKKAEAAMSRKRKRSSFRPTGSQVQSSNSPPAV